MALCPSKLLVVEPQDVLRRFLVSLGQRRYEVDTVTSGAGMLAALRSGRYHVIIVNAELPDADVLVLAEHAASQGCGVVAITHECEQERTFRGKGFYILPPTFTDIQLLRAIDTAGEEIGLRRHALDAVSPAATRDSDS